MRALLCDTIAVKAEWDSQGSDVPMSPRNSRIRDAKPRIPGLLWSGLLFGAGLLTRSGVNSASPRHRSTAQFRFSTESTKGSSGTIRTA